MHVCCSSWCCSCCSTFLRFLMRVLLVSSVLCVLFFFACSFVLLLCAAERSILATARHQGAEWYGCEGRPPMPAASLLRSGSHSPLFRVLPHPVSGSLASLCFLAGPVHIIRVLHALDELFSGCIGFGVFFFFVLAASAMLVSGVFGCFGGGSGLGALGWCCARGWVCVSNGRKRGSRLTWRLGLMLVGGERRWAGWVHGWSGRGSYEAAQGGWDLAAQ